MTQKIAMVPSYEPNGTLIEVVKELNENKYIVIVIDDGSGKKYESIFEKCKAFSHVISYVLK